MNQSEKKYILKRLEEIYCTKKGQLQEKGMSVNDATVIKRQIEDNTLKLLSDKQVLINIKNHVKDYLSSPDWSMFVDNSNFGATRKQIAKEIKEFNSQSKKKLEILKAKYTEARDSVMLGEYGLAELQKFIDFQI